MYWPTGQLDFTIFALPRGITWALRIKVHLTPNFFISLVEISLYMQLFSEKKIDLLNSLFSVSLLKFHKSRQNGDILGSRPSSKGHVYSRSVTHYRELAFTDSFVISTYFHHFFAVALASLGWIKYLTKGFYGVYPGGGGGTPIIFSWGCAAGTLRTLTCT